jgi:hypothetical protein
MEIIGRLLLAASPEWSAGTSGRKYLAVQGPGGGRRFSSLLP